MLMAIWTHDIGQIFWHTRAKKSFSAPMLIWHILTIKFIDYSKNMLMVRGRVVDRLSTTRSAKVYRLLSKSSIQASMKRPWRLCPHLVAPSGYSGSCRNQPRVTRVRDGHRCRFLYSKKNQKYVNGHLTSW
jgi:hypothetical protein